MMLYDLSISFLVMFSIFDAETWLLYYAINISQVAVIPIALGFLPRFELIYIRTLTILRYIIETQRPTSRGCSAYHVIPGQDKSLSPPHNSLPPKPNGQILG
jgi:hypothetical protein